MKLEISSFADAGHASRERLVLRVLSPTNVGEYMIIRSMISRDGGPTSGRKTAYWFPDKRVNTGDLVILYSKSGTTGEKKLKTGSTAHFFYWGLESPVWGEGKYGATVAYLTEWDFDTPET
jgi:hypothetical protein